MKVLSRQLILSLFLAAAAGLTPGFGRDGPRDKHNDRDDGATARVKFSDASKPGTLKLSLPWAEARVTAIDGNEVIVSSSLDEKTRRGEVDHEGFRRLDDDLTFELTEKNNVATITIAGDNPWMSNGAEFDIKVPRNTNLILRTEAGGDINVKGVEGDIDISSMNGEVTLEDIASSAVVNTMNGEVHVSFSKAPVKPVSLSSMNGEINLRLPSNTKANLRMRTHNGSIRTNFPEGVLQTKTEKSARYGPESAFVVSVRADTTIRIGENSTPISLSDLEKAAAEFARSNENAVVVVRPDEKGDVKVVTAVMTELRKAGVSKIRLQTASEDRLSADQRELQRELAHVDRERARVQREVNQAVAEANVAAAEAMAGVTPVAPVAKVSAVAHVAPMAPIPPVPPVPNFGGKSIVGTLNGGGIDIKLTSMNGTITLRESK